MRIINRRGETVDIRFDRILDRIIEQSHNLDGNYIDPSKICQEVIGKIKDGIHTSEIDNFIAQICYNHAMEHPDFDVLAVRIEITNIHRNIRKTFSETMKMLNEITDEFGNRKQLISDLHMNFIKENATILDRAIRPQNDFQYDYFGLQTLIRNKYLMTMNNILVETPQFMLMRASVSYHYGNVNQVIQVYNSMSDLYYIAPSPTLYNACGTDQQLISCFLLGTDDSIEELFRTITNAAYISKRGGGIGIHVGNVRARGSHIYGTNGKSSGLVPMAKVYNEVAKWINQGGKRLGAIALYCPIWHPDIRDFIDITIRHGDMNMKAPNIYNAITIPDLFMKRLKSDDYWTLLNPEQCPGLYDSYGVEFERLYSYYETVNGGEKIKASDLHNQICRARVESGMPYIMYIDHMNNKSNQKNIGTIKSSNLCTEIIEYSDKDEYGCCVLASVNLVKYWDGKSFDYETLSTKTYEIVGNLENVIDFNVYPVEEAKRSNLKHRPLGIGFSGMAKLFALMRIPFDGPEARVINRKIVASMYFGALSASCHLSMQKGSYSSYQGSPTSKGLLQYDLWNESPDDMWDWKTLKENIAMWGLRHSLLIAIMPTQSTAQILSNTEFSEPYVSNLFTRETLGGRYVVQNIPMVRHFIELGIWNEDLRNQLKIYDGSIQQIDTISDEIKNIYKTIYEIPQKSLIEMAADRGPYICQSQSLNLYYYEDIEEDLAMGKLNIIERIGLGDMYGWELGLKTGSYYTRNEKKSSAMKIVGNKRTYESTNEAEKRRATAEEVLVCSLKNKEACEACTA